MKTKYDWLAAFEYIVNRTLLGIIASFFLVLFLIVIAIIGITLLLTTFGWLTFITGGVILSVITLAILTYCEIKNRGNRYAKY